MFTDNECPRCSMSGQDGVLCTKCAEEQEQELRTSCLDDPGDWDEDEDLTSPFYGICLCGAFLDTNWSPLCSGCRDQY